MNPYESDRLLNLYLLSHYGSAAEIFGGSNYQPAQVEGTDFPVQTVAKGFRPVADRSQRALDAGCAVGRSTFELSRYAGEVIGIDFSEAFIDAAIALAKGEVIPYHRYEEGHLSTPLEARLPAGAEPRRVTFQQGDAMNLPNSLGQFDLVHAANLICRLSDPARFLSRLADLVRPEGQLVIATPCTWLADYTPEENWPETPTLDFLREHLSGSFDLVRVMELPFIIREHARKFQFSHSQTSLWQRLS